MNASGDNSGRKQRGRPPSCPVEVCIHVIELHNQGLSLSQIGMTLTHERVLTPGGSLGWTKYTVDRLWNTLHVRELRKKFETLTV